MNTRTENNVSGLVKVIGWLWHNLMYILGIRATIPASLLVLIVVTLAWALWEPRSVIGLWKFLSAHANEQVFSFTIPLPHIN